MIHAYEPSSRSAVRIHSLDTWKVSPRKLQRRSLLSGFLTHYLLGVPNATSEVSLRNCSSLSAAHTVPPLRSIVSKEAHTTRNKPMYMVYSLGAQCLPDMLISSFSTKSANGPAASSGVTATNEISQILRRYSIVGIERLEGPAHPPFSRSTGRDRCPLSSLPWSVPRPTRSSPTYPSSRTRAIYHQLELTMSTT